MITVSEKKLNSLNKNNFCFLILLISPVAQCLLYLMPPYYLT